MSEAATVELARYGEAPQWCRVCDGRGWIESTTQGVMLETLTCPACGGTGEVYDARR